MTTYQLDCDFCESTVRAQTVETIKARARTHLKTNHTEDVLDALRETYDEVDCHDDCGRVLSLNAADAASVECPRCGFENLSLLVSQYVYWQIERA